MCATCGCGDSESMTISDVFGEQGKGREGWHTHGDGEWHSHAHDAAHADAASHGHSHASGHAHPQAHEHEHEHSHSHSHEAAFRHGQDHPPARARLAHGQLPAPRLDHQPGPELIALEARVLEKNDRLAERNRRWLRSRDIVALNLVSSPGAGKTTLLARTLRDLRGKIDLAVIEGDQATANDARRIEEAGGRAVQINTGSGCHLEADMVARALEVLDPVQGSFLFVENVGNLVCPALFDLGEQAKVVVLSVTEGADKPLKYPHMFGAASLMVLNKIDLAPYVDFDLQACVGYARQVNPDIQVFALSATRGDGLDAWYGWLQEQRPAG